MLNLFILHALGQTGRLHGDGRTGGIERGCCARNGMVSAARLDLCMQWPIKVN
jgi:hypothetical protein